MEEDANAPKKPENETPSDMSLDRFSAGDEQMVSELPVNPIAGAEMRLDHTPVYSPVEIRTSGESGHLSFQTSKRASGVMLMNQILKA